MRIVKVGVLAPTNKGIPLGVQGENCATEVEFDTRPWFREYPHGTVSAVARRYGDQAPYPLSLDVDDGTAAWQVSDTDTAKAGEGAVELTMTSAGARVRSLTFKTLVTASLTDSPVDDDAWYGWLDKAVVKVDETVQSAQRKMAEVDEEWTGMKADVTAKVDECSGVAAQAAEDAHHAKVDAQATAKALESAEGSVAKAEAAAKRAVDAMLDADDSAVEASRSALSAGDSAEAARLSAYAAAKSAGDAAASASNAADSASAASGSASAAEHSATDASNAKMAAQTAKVEAEAAKGEAATSASNAATSATAAAKSASDASASVDAINVIAPKVVSEGADVSINGYSSVAIGVSAACKSKGSYAVAIGNNAVAKKIGTIAIGSSATESDDSKGRNVCVGDNSGVSGAVGCSVAIGSGSKATTEYEFSIGSSELTREITHVSTPTAPTSASTKKYTDDNDTKTLAEAKKYTDANTSNALVGTVSGKLLHVEDAWPCKPLSLTIDGAYKQDGTPSPENPVPITVVENPVLMVTGKNLINADYGINDCFVKNVDGTYTLTRVSTSKRFSEKIPLHAPNGVKICLSGATDITRGKVSTLLDFDDGTQSTMPFFNGEISSVNPKKSISQITFYIEDSVEVGESFTFAPQIEYGTNPSNYAPYIGASLPITLPAEHPYLAKLPDGTCDEIVIDKDGNASLVARVKRIIIAKDGKWRYEKTGGGASIYYIENNGKNKTVGLTTCAVGRYAYSPNSVFVGNGGYPTLVDGDETDANGVIDKFGENNPVYYQLATPVTYHLGKLDIPSLPETISNVWTGAELTTNMSMTYKRDINIAFDNLVQAVVAAAAGE